MDTIKNDEHIVEYERFFEEDGSLLIAAECSWRGMADELQKLHYHKSFERIDRSGKPYSS